MSTDGKTHHSTNITDFRKRKSQCIEDRYTYFVNLYVQDNKIGHNQGNLKEECVVAAILPSRMGRVIVSPDLFAAKSAKQVFQA